MQGSSTDNFCINAPMVVVVPYYLICCLSVLTKINPSFPTNTLDKFSPRLNNFKKIFGGKNEKRRTHVKMDLRRLAISSFPVFTEAALRISCTMMTLERNIAQFLVDSGHSKGRQRPVFQRLTLQLTIELN